MAQHKDRPSPLLAVFYSEFDVKAGPKVMYQYPEKFISSEHFDGVSDVIITGKYLSEHIVGVAAYDWFIVGYPVEITHDKYERNTLLFNVSFVFTKHAFTLPYHALLRKLGNTLKSVELSSGYLLKPETKVQVRRVLQEVLVGIHRYGEAEVRLNDSHQLGLRLLWPPAAIPEVHDSDVPVRRVAVGWGEYPDSSQAEEWDRPSWGHQSYFDLALVQVMPHIDGVKYVKLISSHAEVDIAVVKRTLRALLFYNQITLVDSFTYRSVYVPTDRTTELLADADFRETCWEKIKLVDQSTDAGEESTLSDGGGDEGGGWASDDPAKWGSSSAFPGSSRPPPPPDRCRLTRLFLSFNEGRNVGDVLRRDKELLELIDHRKFCAFGVTSGLLRRKFTHLCLVKKPSNRCGGRVGSRDTGALVNEGITDNGDSVVDSRKGHSTLTVALPHAEDLSHSTALQGRGSPPPHPAGNLEKRYTVAEVQAMLVGYPTEEAMCCHLECDRHELEAYVTRDGVHELIKFQGV